MKKMSGNGRSADWTPGSSARHRDQKMPKYREYSPVASPVKFQNNEGYAEEEEEDPIKALQSSIENLHAAFDRMNQNTGKRLEEMMEQICLVRTDMQEQGADVRELKVNAGTVVNNILALDENFNKLDMMVMKEMGDMKENISELVEEEVKKMRLKEGEERKKEMDGLRAEVALLQKGQRCGGGGFRGRE